MIVFKKHA